MKITVLVNGDRVFLCREGEPILAEFPNTRQEFGWLREVGQDERGTWFDPEYWYGTHSVLTRLYFETLAAHEAE